MYSFFLRMTAVLLFAGWMSCAAASEVPAEGDVLWQNVYEKVDGLDYATASRRFSWGTAEFWEWHARERRQVMQRGLEAWRRYPRHAAAYQWLENIIDKPPLFWMDEKQGASAYSKRRWEEAIIDVAGYARWRTDLVALKAAIRHQVLDGGPDDWTRMEILYRALTNEALMIPRLKAQGIAVDATALIREVIDFCAANPREDVKPQLLLLATNVAGLLEAPEKRAFAEGLSHLPGPGMAQLAAGLHRQWRMTVEPPPLQLTAMNGEAIDLAQMRGKVVLLQIWSQNCSSCIESMPALQSVYSRYQDRGFEIVGICLAVDAASEGAIRGILDRNGVTYPNVFLAGADRVEFKEKYAVVGFPETWLMNQEGLLVTSNVGPRNLEAWVRKLLRVAP